MLALHESTPSVAALTHDECVTVPPLALTHDECVAPVGVQPEGPLLLPLAGGLTGFLGLGACLWAAEPGEPALFLTGLIGIPLAAAFTAPGLLVAQQVLGHPAAPERVVAALMTLVTHLGRVALALLPVLALFAANRMIMAVTGMAILGLGMLGLAVGARALAALGSSAATSASLIPMLWLVITAPVALGLLWAWLQFVGG